MVRFFQLTKHQQTTENCVQRKRSEDRDGNRSEQHHCDSNTEALRWLDGIVCGVFWSCRWRHCCGALPVCDRVLRIVCWAETEVYRFPFWSITFHGSRLYVEEHQSDFSVTFGSFPYRSATAAYCAAQSQRDDHLNERLISKISSREE